ncbi:MAG TPA: antitoxin MazE family protein [Xanthobacteraceae bacterium]|nr:antitoxin MazE family protein [Xanthobacteraceae bacterium]
MAGRPSARNAKPARMRPKSSRDKVRNFRQRMRAKGMRLVQFWLPDTRTATFAKEARRQSLFANRSAFAAEDQAWVDAMTEWNHN